MVFLELCVNRHDGNPMKLRSRVAKRAAAKAPLSSPGKPQPEVLTIGHSTRSIEEFIHLLKAHVVDCVVDVRTIPRSRTNPQFNADALPSSLKKVDIDYKHIAALGGLRHATADSVNAGWRNASFRGFADYMQTSRFGKAVGKLIRLTSRRRLALMCAEAVPWRCHRSLIADALVARGVGVEHIMSRVRRRVHILTPFAKVQGCQITYPATNLPSENA